MICPARITKLYASNLSTICQKDESTLNTICAQHLYEKPFNGSVNVMRCRRIVCVSSHYNIHSIFVFAFIVFRPSVRSFVIPLYSSLSCLVILPNGSLTPIPVPYVSAYTEQTANKIYVLNPIRVVDTQTTGNEVAFFRCVCA